LLYSALDEYRQALGNIPARLVIHKTSNFNDAELDGFRSAVKAHKINTVDFVTIFDTSMRLLRDGQYPPYRGTHVELDENNHILYTRGSVKFYQTYPGLYIPRPLEIRLVEYDESPSIICQEILGLTKMNWNNTQFDGKYPITIECARKVGQIMKYLSEEDKPQIRYSFYM
jgi:argonaute-like protein implicated in RNA metabolism and viral defense